jgi:hypothetical protein
MVIGVFHCVFKACHVRLIHVPQRPNACIPQQSKAEGHATTNAAKLTSAIWRSLDDCFDLVIAGEIPL